MSETKRGRGPVGSTGRAAQKRVPEEGTTSSTGADPGQSRGANRHERRAAAARARVRRDRHVPPPAKYFLFHFLREGRKVPVAVWNGVKDYCHMPPHPLMGERCAQASGDRLWHHPASPPRQLQDDSRRPVVDAVRRDHLVGARSANLRRAGGGVAGIQRLPRPRPAARRRGGAA